MQDRTMMRAFRFIVENAGNPELKIDDISNEIGMSRSVLYNKVKATTGMTPEGMRDVAQDRRYTEQHRLCSRFHRP